MLKRMLSMLLLFCAVGLTIVAVATRYSTQFAQPTATVRSSSNPLRDMFNQGNCTEPCFLGLELGTSQQNLDDFLLINNIQYTKTSILPNIFDEYLVVNSAFSWLGKATQAHIWVNNQVFTSVIVGPTELCPISVFEDLGYPSYWYQIEESYELYYAGLQLIIYISRTNPSRIGSFRILSEEAFRFFIENSNLQLWDQDIAAVFDCK